MAIKNYTTTVPAHKTIAQVQRLLAEHGAARVMIDYEGGSACGLSFVVATPAGPRGFALPARVGAVRRVLEAQGVKHDPETSERVAWRNVKDWVEAQIAIIETGQAELTEVFLPYMIDSAGTTLYEAHCAGLLGDGEKEGCE